MRVMEIMLEVVGWDHLAQVKDSWRGAANTVTNVRFP
jgi:hypothetical protein